MVTPAPTRCRAWGDRVLLTRGWTLVDTPDGGRVARLVRDGVVLVEEPIDPPCPCTAPPDPARGGTHDRQH